MSSGGCRVVPAFVRVGDKDVELTIREEYGPDDSGIPIHVRIGGPNGLATRGKYPEVWQEMLELLGVRKPALDDLHSALGQDEQPEAACETEGPSAAAFTPAAATPALTGDPHLGRVSAGSAEDIGIEPERTRQHAHDVCTAPLAFGLNNSKSLQPIEKPLPAFHENVSHLVASSSIGNSTIEQDTQNQSRNQNQSQSQNQNQSQSQSQNPAGAAAGPDEFEDDMKLEEEEQKEEEEKEEEVEAEEDPGLNQNVFRDSMLRLLNQRIYSDDPPLKIDRRMEAYIPYLHSTQEAANLIGHIEENIRLTKMKADASRRAANLNYLKKANRAKRCGHVKVNGQTCGSPALRGQQYCHFHTQALGGSLDLPLIEDESSLQLAYLKLAQQIAANKIAPAQARILLQVLDKAGRGIPKPASMVERRFPGM